MTLLEQSKNTDFHMPTSSQSFQAEAVKRMESSHLARAAHSEDNDNPFAHQLDMVSRQAALQDVANPQQSPNIDLTTIHNVPVMQSHRNQHQKGTPSRQPGHRRGNNGLYDGFGVAGIPMSATAPFPSPMAPHGRPAQTEGMPTRYVGYTIGTDACGSVNIEVAAERGGDVCDTCDSSR
jgi:hypothetical protein